MKTKTPHPWRKSYRSPRATSISAPVWVKVPNELCPDCGAGIESNGEITMCENRGKCDYVIHATHGRLD